MDFNFTTPGLLFPAISLLLLAYTNRFLALANLIRQLKREHQATSDPIYIGQIRNLQRRVRLTRNMQFAGVASLLFCTVCMFLLFVDETTPAEWIFAASLVLMMISLGISLVEIQISVKALDLHLHDLECEAGRDQPGPG